MALTTAVPCFGRPGTTVPAASKQRSPRMASTSWCAPIRRSLDSRSECMHCVRLPPPTRSITTPTSPGFRNGSATPTSLRRGSTTTAERGPRIARHSRWLIDMPQPNNAGPLAERSNDGICRILSLDGGGAKGFYTLGVLKEIEGLIKGPLYQRFDLVFGTSTGAIIAALIALGHTVDEIHDLYKKHVPTIM